MYCINFGCELLLCVFARMCASAYTDQEVSSLGAKTVHLNDSRATHMPEG